MEIYLYLIVLTIILLLIISSFRYTKNAPIKIGFMGNIIFFSMFLRTLAIIYMILSSNILYMYILKPLIFLNIVYLPLIPVICFLMYHRVNKIDIKKLILFMMGLIVSYIVVLSKLPVKMIIYDSVYVFQILNKFICIPWIMLNVVFLVVVKKLFKKSRYSKRGGVFISIASVISLIETSLILFDFRIINYSLLQDLCWLLALIYGLSKIRKVGI